jgi:hypothetical protein
VLRDERDLSGTQVHIDIRWLREPVYFKVSRLIALRRSVNVKLIAEVNWLATEFLLEAVGMAGGVPSIKTAQAVLFSILRAKDQNNGEIEYIDVVLTDDNPKLASVLPRDLQRFLSVLSAPSGAFSTSPSSLEGVA